MKFLLKSTFAAATVCAAISAFWIHSDPLAKAQPVAPPAGEAALSLLLQNPGGAAAPAPLPAIPKPPAETSPRADAPSIPLVLIGAHHGELEPCGCSGGQLGGLGRMKTRLDAMIQFNPRTIILDAGEFVKTFSDQGMAALGEATSAIVKMESSRGEVAASIFQEIPLSVIGLGPRDLAYGPEFASLRAQLMQVPGDTQRFPTLLYKSVIANHKPAEGILPSTVILTKDAAGTPVPVFVTSIIDAENAKYSNPGGALRAELTQGAGKYQLAIVIFHGVRERVRAYAAAFPEIDLWLVAPGTGSADSAPAQEGGALVVHAGDRGRAMVKMDLGRSGGRAAAANYESILVSASDPNDKSVQGKIDGYRVRLGEEKIVELLKGKRRTPEETGVYAGPESCKQCHATAYDTWSKSKHSHALESLTARIGQNDPECIRCHATGWHSDPPSGEVTSYRGDGVGGKLAFVSCESCHGPSLKHTKTPKAVKPPREINCEKCHDHDNSPSFDRAKYWPKIAHKKDKDQGILDKPESAPAK